MKVSQATIRLYLKVSKVLSDGSSPIMLIVSYNKEKKEKSTGFSCVSRYWDKKREEVKKGFSNYIMVNAEIYKLKNLAIESRNRLISSSIDYNVKMIIDGMYVERKIDLKRLEDAIERYKIDKCLRKSTHRNWTYLYNLMSEYKDKDILVSEIDESCVRGFVQWCGRNGISDGVIRMLCGELGAICKYGIGLGLMREDDYPFRVFKYTEKYKVANNILYIHRKTIEFMKEWFLKRVIEVNGDRWSYIDGIEESVCKEKGELFPLYLYLMLYMLQGIAPVDISLLKKANIDVKVIKGNDYWSIDLKRQKTNKAVPIRIKRHVRYNEVMMGLALMFVEGEYFLPIIQDSHSDIEIQKTRAHWVFKCCMKKLYVFWKSINADIIRHNVQEKDDIPTIDEKCTYYSARHSYATHYMEKGGNALDLARLLGRSVNTIGTYISMLGRDEDLAVATSIMD